MCRLLLPSGAGLLQPRTIPLEVLAGESLSGSCRTHLGEEVPHME